MDGRVHFIGIDIEHFREGNDTHPHTYKKTFPNPPISLKLRVPNEYIGGGKRLFLLFFFFLSPSIKST